MRNILGPIRRAIEDYNMIEDGDKVAVALSGGKDSISLLYQLKSLQYFYSRHFELIAISVNPGFEFFDEAFLQETCDKLGIELIIERYNIKTIVFDERKEKNPCSLCANLRRGILNTVAQREHCNKIALGHNLDDVLETFLMNLFYDGSLSTFSPVSYMDRSNITLIRPLIYLQEKDTKAFVKHNNIRIMNKVCPMDGNSTREDMNNLIISFAKKIPHVRSNIIGAIKRNNIDGWRITERLNTQKNSTK